MDYFLSSPTAEGYGFVHEQHYSKPGLVSRRGHPGSGRFGDGRGRGTGEVVLGRVQRLVLVSAPHEGLFLGMQFVPQEPVYLHHRLRRQLAQYL